MEQWEIEVTVDDCAPSVNRAYFFMRKGKRTIKVKTKVAKEWMELVQQEFRKKYNVVSGVVIPFSPLEVSLEFYFDDRRKHDCDNFQKLTLDACTGNIWYDDTQIQKITSEKFEGCGGRKTVIKVRTYKKEVNNNVGNTRQVSISDACVMGHDF